LNLEKETDTQIKKDMILDKAKHIKLGFLRFCDYIGEKILNFGRGRVSSTIGETPYKKGVKKLWNEFGRQILSTTLSGVIVIAICTVVNLLDWSLGYEVIVDGENIGMIVDRNVVYEAIGEVSDEIKLYLGEDATYQKEPVFVRRIVAEKDLSDKEALKIELLSGAESTENLSQSGKLWLIIWKRYKKNLM